jgi:outer membrane cobalamin receptor
MNRRPTLLSSLIARCCIGLTMSLPLPSLGAQSEGDVSSFLHTGDSLQSALATLNSLGYRVLYSSAVVQADMTLAAKPRSNGIENVLEEILSPWNLRAIKAANGDWLIVRAGNGRSMRTPAASESLAGGEVAAMPIENIDVTATRFGIAGAANGGTVLSREDVQSMPHLGDDAMRVLKALPGVSGGDYSAKLNIRGGRRDEVLMLIDGAEIHHGFHFQEDAILSIVDTNLVDSIDFTTGGMTADRGDFMSGVVDIHTLMPKVDDEHRHALGISFIGAFGRTTRTFADGRGSWIASARRSYLDLLMQEVQDGDEQVTPEYQDVFSALRYQISERDAVSLHALLGADELRVTEDDDESSEAGESESSHLWFTWNRAWFDGLDSNTILAWATMDRHRNNFEDSEFALIADVRSTTNLEFIDVKQDWQWRTGTNHLVKWGISAGYQNAEYDYRLESLAIDPFDPSRTIPLSRDTELHTSGEKIGAYGAYLARVFDALSIEIGARWDRYSYEDYETYDRVGPRINAVYQPNEHHEFRAAWGIVHQPHGIDQLQVEDGVIEIFQPEQARQAVMGYLHRFGRGWSLRTDLYRKDYSDLRPRFENEFDSLRIIAEAEYDRIRIDADRARAEGIEVTLRRDTLDQWGGWFSYGFSKAEERDNDAWYSRQWDQRHSVSFGAMRQGANWSINFQGLYHSGAPSTSLRLEPHLRDDGTSRTVLERGSRYDDRLGYFLRFDLRASRQAYFDSGTLTYYFDIYNLLGRSNPCCVQELGYAASPGRAPSLTTREGYWFPRLPSFGFLYEF